MDSRVTTCIVDLMYYPAKQQNILIFCKFIFEPGTCTSAIGLPENYGKWDLCTFEPEEDLFVMFLFIKFSDLLPSNNTQEMNTLIMHTHSHIHTQKKNTKLLTFSIGWYLSQSKETKIKPV